MELKIRGPLGSVGYIWSTENSNLCIDLMIIKKLPTCQPVKILKNFPSSREWQLRPVIKLKFDFLTPILTLYIMTTEVNENSIVFLIICCNISVEI